jgi:YfiR/HmsC-like
MLTHLKFALVLGATCILCLRGQINEYQVKAFFLYNFARYVEWPPQSFKAVNDPIVICILGLNPFGSALVEAVAGKMVEGRPFVVRQISDIQPGGNCHILFVNSSERKRFRSLAGRLQGSGVLSVGETQGFTTDGGVINFRLEDGKVRFEIDVDAAGREHLHISSKLLTLALIAKEQRGK